MGVLQLYVDNGQFVSTEGWSALEVHSVADFDDIHCCKQGVGLCNCCLSCCPSNTDLMAPAWRATVYIHATGLVWGL